MGFEWSDATSSNTSWADVRVVYMTDLLWGDDASAIRVRVMIRVRLRDLIQFRFRFWVRFRLDNASNLGLQVR